MNKRRANLTLTLALFAFSAMCGACIERKHYWSQSQTIDNCSWNKYSDLKFEIPVDDTVSWYLMSLNLRNRTDYGYQNLYLFVQTQSPTGATSRDTLNFMLARDDGKWTGSGGMFSKYRENIFPYRQVKFLQTGVYTLNIRQGMREDDLNGIASIDLTLDKVKSIN